MILGALTLYALFKVGGPGHIIRVSIGSCFVLFATSIEAYTG